jgi:hypothetical protein
MTFEDWIRQMLKSALMAQASIQDFELGGEAADYFSRRALENIKRRSTTNTDIYQGARSGVAAAELFLMRLYARTGRRKMLSESEASNAIGEIRTVDCVYPFCTDIP